ncbi:phage tail assembly protein [Stutzerimonas stutzeri]|uniref:phage tail assembly protein n=1 Tax=Stutzerimonas stutzeri TaxID=316 RepID=UPI0021113B0D|nr:phage tail assembly protein [Stutzerimonas stutzeri]UUC83848.1 phage tail assembly protein [Stutzerimonas stutzeri]
MSQKNDAITLDEPLKRGEQTISSVTVRKPAAGELRGVTLSDLLNLEVNALIKVLPRVTSPSLTEQEVARLDPADLVQLGSKVAGFLLPKSVKAEASLAE